LAISKDFLADYAKLDKDVQRAVDQAVATFARHPQPRLHLERPQHIDDGRLRILPVDTRWRGVVLTAGDTSPEDTYSLVTVLPQDQADAYVTSHRFSINRALKIPQVRAEEAVLQPSLHAPLEGERLSADASDHGLTHPSADAQILPTVRLLAGEEALEALQTALPDPQHATLNTLADGTTVDEALTELAHVTLAPGRGNPPFSLVHPFAAWRRFRTRTSRDNA